MGRCYSWTWLYVFWAQYWFMYLVGDFNRDFLLALFSGLIYNYFEIAETVRVTSEGLANGNVTDVFVNGTSLLDISQLNEEADYWLYIQVLLIGVSAALAILTFPASSAGYDLFNFVTTGTFATAVVVFSFLVIPFTERTVAVIVDSGYVTSSTFQLYGSIAVNCLFILNAGMQYKLELQNWRYKNVRKQLMAHGEWTEEQEEDYKDFLHQRSNLAFMYDTVIVPQQQRLGLKPVDEETKLETGKVEEDEKVQEGIQ